MGSGGADSPKYVYVDGKFYEFSFTAIRRQPLLVTSEHISWRGKSIELYRLTALAYWKFPITAAGAAAAQLVAYSYNIKLLSNKTRLTISLYGMKKDKKTPLAFQETIEALRAHVEPRLVREVLARIDQGEQFKVGSLSLSRAGIYNKGFIHSESASWSSLEIHPSPLGTAKASTQNIYARDSRNSRRKIGKISPTTPNAVLVPSLIGICASRYSTG
jgi:hypothetical protein